MNIVSILMILLNMLLSSLWAIIIIEEFQPFIQLKTKLGFGIPRKIVSEYIIIDYILFLIWKLISCCQCFSYWLFSFSYLILYGSGLGFILGAIVYFLTYYIKKTLYISI